MLPRKYRAHQYLSSCCSVPFRPLYVVCQVSFSLIKEKIMHNVHNKRCNGLCWGRNTAASRPLQSLLCIEETPVAPSWDPERKELSIVLAYPFQLLVWRGSSRFACWPNGVYVSMFFFFYPGFASPVPAPTESGLSRKEKCYCFILHANGLSLLEEGANFLAVVLFVSTG